MNIAVLADIHGNNIAFERCLDYIKDREIDAYCFLGDYIGEFPGIKKTLKRLYSLQNEKPCYIIKGNKENYQLTGLGENHPEWDSFPSTIGMIRYGLTQLSDRDIEYIKALPISNVIRIDGKKEFVICHGSVHDVRKSIYGKRGVDHEELANIEQEYIVYGHTHKIADLTMAGKRIWNPGSVGLSLDGTAKTEFMILHSDNEEWKPEFVALDYDVEEVIHDMKKHHFYEIAPVWTLITENLLRRGTVSHGTVLSRAIELCYIETGQCVWPCVPEKHFMQAYDELIASVK